ncbi:MAG: shikimate dehydrogenase [Alphaproteobacteria bacterium]
MKLAGVMGWPIGHSQSPKLHGHWLKRYGIDGAYVPLAVHPDDAEQALRALPKLGFAGCNVTLPHKQIALAVCDQVDPYAARVGAVNTIVVQPDGSLRGSNTDGPGFMAHLQASAPDIDLSGSVVTVLGAGGASRAVVASLLDAGIADLRLINRSLDKAQTLIEELDATDRASAAGWADASEALTGASLLVNTTSLGMTDQPALELDLTALPREAAVYDLVYAPLQTDLLARAAMRGNTAIDGLGMLLHQAAPGFEAWFGTAPQVDEELRAAILAR